MRATLISLVFFCLSAQAQELNEFIEDEATSAFELVLGGEPIAGRALSARASLTFNQSLPAGSTIVIASHWMHAPLQNSDSEAPGYVELLSGGMTAIAYPGSGVWGGLETIAMLPGFELEAGEIAAGTPVEFRIHQLYLPDRVPQQFYLTAFLITEDGDQTLRTEPLEIVAGEMDSLNLVADSLVQPGQDINLRLRMQDRFGNLVANRRLSLDLLVNGTFRNRVNLDSAYSTIPEVRFDVAGVYQLEVRTGGGGLRAVSNPVLVSNRTEKLLWLDLGAHTTSSDGQQSLAELLSSNRGVFDLTLAADHAGSVEPDALSETARYEESSPFPVRDGAGKSIAVALAENPTDTRYVNPDLLRLAQVASDQSDYTWFGEAVSSRGYRTGFVGIAHSHRSGGGSSPILTAVIQKEGESWFDGLSNRRTYVATGSKTILLTDQESLSFDDERRLDIEVHGMSPVKEIRLIKNGEPIASSALTDIDSGFYTLAVEASNQPISGLESRPRNAREWIGFFRTRDTAIEIMGSSGSWQSRGSGSQRIDFLARTHGAVAEMDLRLVSPTPDTVIEMGFAGVFEDTAWIPEDRLPQKIAAQRFLVPFGELERGAVRVIDAAGYQDRVIISPAKVPQGTTARFSHVDPSPPRIGDYYYFRVSMADGSVAVSSPVFVEKRAGKILPDLGYDHHEHPEIAEENENNEVPAYDGQGPGY